MFLIVIALAVAAHAPVSLQRGFTTSNRPGARTPPSSTVPATWPPAQYERWPRDLPLERLGQRESTKALDARRDRVHPPVPASHPAARLRQDPPFRLPGAPPPAFRTP